jgi:hypothetical protein
MAGCWQLWRIHNIQLVAPGVAAMTMPAVFLVLQISVHPTGALCCVTPEIPHLCSDAPYVCKQPAVCLQAGVNITFITSTRLIKRGVYHIDQPSSVCAHIHKYLPPHAGRLYQSVGVQIRGLSRSALQSLIMHADTIATAIAAVQLAEVSLICQAGSSWGCELYDVVHTMTAMLTVAFSCATTTGPVIVQCSDISDIYCVCCQRLTHV